MSLKSERPCDLFGEWDELLVTGRITSEPGQPRVTRLRCMAATVYQRGHQPSDPDAEPDYFMFFKVWPENDSDPQLPPNHNGKLWFNWPDPETVVEIVRKDED